MLNYLIILFLPKSNNPILIRYIITTFIITEFIAIARKDIPHKIKQAAIIPIILPIFFSIFSKVNDFFFCFFSNCFSYVECLNSFTVLDCSFFPTFFLILELFVLILQFFFCIHKFPSFFSFIIDERRSFIRKMN